MEVNKHEHEYILVGTAGPGKEPYWCHKCGKIVVLTGPKEKNLTYEIGSRIPVEWSD